MIRIIITIMIISLRHLTKLSIHMIMFNHTHSNHNLIIHHRPTTMTNSSLIRHLTYIISRVRLITNAHRPRRQTTRLQLTQQRQPTRLTRTLIRQSPIRHANGNLILLRHNLLYHTSTRQHYTTQQRTTELHNKHPEP